MKLTEKQKNFPYCRSNKGWFSGFFAFISESQLLIGPSMAAADDHYTMHISINYCPMCGRKLREW